MHAAWYTLAYTGMRRGELLALRWRDIDLDAGMITIRRSVGVVKHKGQPEQITEGGTKTLRPRVIDIEPATVAVLRAWKSKRGAIGLHLARGGSVVFRNVEGGFRHPETIPGVPRHPGALRPDARRGCPARHPAARSEALARDDPANRQSCI